MVHGWGLMGAAFGSRLSAIGQKWQEGGVEAVIGNRLSALKPSKRLKVEFTGKKLVGFGRIGSDWVGLGRMRRLGGMVQGSGLNGPETAEIPAIGGQASTSSG
jgi:hypothetical protein